MTGMAEEGRRLALMKLNGCRSCSSPGPCRHQGGSTMVDLRLLLHIHTDATATRLKNCSIIASEGKFRHLRATSIEARSWLTARITSQLVVNVE